MKTNGYLSNGAYKAVREIIEENPEIQVAAVVERLPEYNPGTVKQAAYETRRKLGLSKPINKTIKSKTGSKDSGYVEDTDDQALRISLEIPSRGIAIKLMNENKTLIGTLRVSLDGFSYTASGTKLKPPQIGYEQAVKLFASGLLG